ncbi:MAG: hypothetical protein IH899_07090 [Planctomycetes bacterium]|nr:hypothetical protein [Planctomycetota bacterium]
MPKKSDDKWLPDQRGRYRRKVGWWVSEAGKRKQYPFSFGTEKDQAKVRLIRVRELWAQVVKLHDEPKEQIGFPPLFGEQAEPNGEPFWNGESLWIAKHLAAGDVHIPVGAIPEIPDYVVAMQVQTLAKSSPLVKFVVNDQERYESGS